MNEEETAALIIELTKQRDAANTSFDEMAELCKAAKEIGDKLVIERDQYRELAREAAKLLEESCGNPCNIGRFGGAYPGSNCEPDCRTAKLLNKPVVKQLLEEKAVVEQPAERVYSCPICGRPMMAKREQWQYDTPFKKGTWGKAMHCSACEFKAFWPEEAQ